MLWDKGVRLIKLVGQENAPKQAGPGCSWSKGGCTQDASQEQVRAELAGSWEEGSQEHCATLSYTVPGSLCFPVDRYRGQGGA